MPRCPTHDDLVKDYLEYNRRSKRSHTTARKRRLTAEEEAVPREQRPLAVATVNHHLKLLNAVYNRAVRGISQQVPSASGATRSARPVGCPEQRGARGPRLREA